ncbi:MAG: hypothetical protein US76_04175 [Parcubacteria group bacterium GW2011_GWA2_38_13b]|nr:MAG: hypothetical protein US76_04175 [Parcubacteria group bacterium GW2011_GWA2_38_13b]
MDYRLLRYFWGIVFFVFVASTAVSGQINHNLKVVLFPDSYRIEVVDTIILPERADARPIIFALHQDLNPKVLSEGAVLKKIGVEEGLEIFEITLPFGTHQFTIAYGGEIFHPVDEDSEEYARGFSATPGIISPEGVFLAESTVWYPYFHSYFIDGLITFNMEVKLPIGWSSVSQGLRIKHCTGTDFQADFQLDKWTIDEPQEEIYLIAAKFIEYNQVAGDVNAMVFLRKPNKELAQKYLDATAQYLEIYSKLLGPYPYKKFALVENFWETGYGMPSFTLLGSQIINLPFIIYTSYPHEILHNWWGNGIFVDSDKGNWCEGLTAYLADHFLKEQNGEAIEYRRSTLQKYKDYVSGNKDFPISQFNSRNNAATEVVGYGKTLMFFHMLRRQVGDEVFFNSLRRFYQEYVFKRASFNDIEKVFSETSGQNLKWIFEQWIERTGAPSLRMRDVSAKQQGDKYLLSAVIEQIQDAASYRLKVPTAVYMENSADVYRTDIEIDSKNYNLEITLPAKPTRLDIDPEFDVFRMLDRNEIPPAISQIFGAERALAVLPAVASESVKNGYRELAKSWRLEIKFDNELKELPSNRAVWLFGWENRFRPEINQALVGYDFTGDNQCVRIGGTELNRDRHSVVVMARHPSNNSNALGWLATDNASAMSGLGRKLSHYNKYSYLAFTGNEPTNVFKGQWPAVNSPLSISIREEAEIRMEKVVQYLASEELEGRGLGTQGIYRAGKFIADQFHKIGLKPVGYYDYFQPFAWTCVNTGKTYTVDNIVGMIPGKNSVENIVIGAHYDHLGRGEIVVKDEKYKGKIHPGANDNASGVAVLLEVARSLINQNFQPERNIVFVAFSGEEAGRIGSKHYASHMNFGEKCAAMINLDTVGQIENDKVLIIGAQSAKEWKEILEKSSLAVSLKIDFITMDLDSSDQKSFHEAGIPAIQIFSGTDLSYHSPIDTVDKINFNGLVKVARFTEEAIKGLIKRNLAATINVEEIRSKKPQEKIKVSLGTIPDFTYHGIGYRLAGVKSESLAVEAGLQVGDIIVKINKEDIKDLRGFADTLRSLKIGDKIFIVFLRNEERREIEAVLK